MKFSSQLLLGLITFTFIPEPSSLEPIENIFSVSPLIREDGKQFYLDCKHKNKDVRTLGDESEITDKVCAVIFKSGLFNDIHRVHSVSRSTEGNKCLAKKHHSQETLEYCISPEYILDSAGRRGRFVFQDGAAIAIAEQPANVSDFGLHAKYDAFKGLAGKLAILGNDDGAAVCNLTAFNKLRLCSTVLNAEKYRSDVSFSPLEEPTCVKKKLISQEDTDGKVRWSFTKWAIECTAVPIRKQTAAIFHVSKTVQSPNLYVISVGAERNTAVLSSLADVNLYLSE